MKKSISDILFIQVQTIKLGFAKYSQVLHACVDREKTHGDNYGSEYIRMHAFYFSRGYDNAYESFYKLFKWNLINSKLIEWGIKLFIKTPLSREKNYQIALIRIEQLLSLPCLSAVVKKELISIQGYCNKQNT